MLRHLMTAVRFELTPLRNRDFRVQLNKVNLSHEIILLNRTQLEEARSAHRPPLKGAPRLSAGWGERRGTTWGDEASAMEEEARNLRQREIQLPLPRHCPHPPRGIPPAEVQGPELRARPGRSAPRTAPSGAPPAGS